MCGHQFSTLPIASTVLSTNSLTMCNLFSSSLDFQRPPHSKWWDLVEKLQLYLCNFYSLRTLLQALLKVLAGQLTHKLSFINNWSKYLLGRIYIIIVLFGHHRSSDFATESKTMVTFDKVAVSYHIYYTLCTL